MVRIWIQRDRVDSDQELLGFATGARKNSNNTAKSYIRLHPHLLVSKFQDVVGPIFGTI